MKTGKKAILAISAALLAYLLVGLLFMPRSSREQNNAPQQANSNVAVVAKDGSVCLADARDSISFAVSMMVARDMPYAMRELGITPATVENFVKGLSDAFPADASSSAAAYAHGVVIGASAMEMLEEANIAIYQSDTTKSVNRGVFLEGLKAVARGNSNTMTFEQAYDYYNESIFRKPSEEFIERNKSRSGVVLISGDVQVKVERAGNGETAAVGDVVGYIYKASFINGNTFDSSRGEVVEAVVDKNMLSGLESVFKTFPAGTKCKVYLPWQSAYGSRGSDKVPPYSAIVYDLEIVKVMKR